jgi:hypothetical protein
MLVQETVSKNLTLWRGSTCGEVLLAPIKVAAFDRVVLSWNCNGPAQFYLEAHGLWHCMGEWGPQARSMKTALVDVDTLKLASECKSIRVRVESPYTTQISLLAVAHWLSSQKYEYCAERSATWGNVLDVPQRSQMSEAKDARSICSPTSLAMVLEFYGVKKATREVADAVFDHAEKIYGNWPFNVAYAQSVLGGSCFVAKAEGLQNLEAEIAAGRPVIASHRFKSGDLDGAPLPESNGHLIVVAGFTADGDVVVNDPAGNSNEVRRIYQRRQFHRTFLELGQGIHYAIRP